MISLEDLQKDVRTIKERNARVEADKAWETSWLRRGLVMVLTYIVIVVFFLVAELPNPWVNAIVPAVAFLLSTVSVGLMKNWWLGQKNKK